MPHIIGAGIVHENGSGVWWIVNKQGVVQAKFDHDMFNYIVDGTPVYFIHPASSQLCDNVQTQGNVNALFKAATPAGGFGKGAEQYLRKIIMDALLQKSVDRDTLMQQMHNIAETVNAHPPQKATLALLKEICQS